MDYLNGGELFFHLQKCFSFPEKRARFYAAEIILALEDLHKKTDTKEQIVYRDLKPENILLDNEGHIKLTDFGLSKFHDLSYSFVGTPEYMAPEIVHGKLHGEAVDFWSLGVIIYEMINGKSPFYNHNLDVMMNNIKEKEIKWPSLMSTNAKDLCLKLMNRNKQKRLGAGKNGIREIKDHRFFEDINWEDLRKKKVNPPFRPKVKGEDCVKNFNKEFTRETVKETPVDVMKISKEEIPGFTYSEENEVIQSRGIDQSK